MTHRKGTSRSRLICRLGLLNKPIDPERYLQGNHQICAYKVVKKEGGRFSHFSCVLRNQSALRFALEFEHFLGVFAGYMGQALPAKPWSVVFPTSVIRVPEVSANFWTWKRRSGTTHPDRQIIADNARHVREPPREALLNSSYRNSPEPVDDHCGSGSIAANSDGTVQSPFAMQNPKPHGKQESREMLAAVDSAIDGALKSVDAIMPTPTKQSPAIESATQSGEHEEPAESMDADSPETVSRLGLRSIRAFDNMTTRNNLEVKFRLDDSQRERIIRVLKTAATFRDILTQQDTYYVVHQGRLKLRQEQGRTKNCAQRAWLIYYERPDNTGVTRSSYDMTVIARPSQLDSLLQNVLPKELVVRKYRSLYTLGNARIHVDNVDTLGYFLEIEVVCKEAGMDNQLMHHLLQVLETGQLEEIAVGYRELLLERGLPDRLLSYYATQNKVFWVVNKPIRYSTAAESRVSGESVITAGTEVPCIFVERGMETDATRKYDILQFPLSIRTDNYQYTAWRKLLGTTLGVQVDVLLIVDRPPRMITLEGDPVSWEQMRRSNKRVPQRCLAAMRRCG